MDLRGWNVIDSERAVLWREYNFSKTATATTMVFRGADGLVVVSPGCGLEAAATMCCATSGTSVRSSRTTSCTPSDRKRGAHISRTR